jgi:hypothetical protein
MRLAQLVTLIAIGIPTIVLAQATTDQKPYAQMDATEQQALTNALTAKVSQRCGRYKMLAAAGETRGTYEAAACSSSIFYLGSPPDYPNRDTYKQQLLQNSKAAKGMGSRAPFLAAAE